MFAVGAVLAASVALVFRGVRGDWRGVTLWCGKIWLALAVLFAVARIRDVGQERPSPLIASLRARQITIDRFVRAERAAAPGMFDQRLLRSNERALRESFPDGDFAKVSLVDVTEGPDWMRAHMKYRGTFNVQGESITSAAQIVVYYHRTGMAVITAACTTEPRDCAQIEPLLSAAERSLRGAVCRHRSGRRASSLGAVLGRDPGFAEQRHGFAGARLRLRARHSVDAGPPRRGRHDPVADRGARRAVTSGRRPDGKSRFMMFTGLMREDRCRQRAGRRWRPLAGHRKSGGVACSPWRGRRCSASCSSTRASRCRPRRRCSSATSRRHPRSPTTRSARRHWSLRPAIRQPRPFSSGRRSPVRRCAAFKAPWASDPRRPCGVVSTAPTISSPRRRACSATITAKSGPGCWAEAASMA